MNYLRFFLGYMVLVFLSCLPAACSRGMGRHEYLAEPIDPPDTGLALKGTPEGCTRDTAGLLFCPDLRPPGAR